MLLGASGDQNGVVTRGAELAGERETQDALPKDLKPQDALPKDVKASRRIALRPEAPDPAFSTNLGFIIFDTKLHFKLKSRDIWRDREQEHFPDQNPGTGRA